MPELPDVVVYIESILSRVRGQTLERVRLASPFFVRSATPPLKTAEGKRVEDLRRLGKRIVFQLEGDLFIVIHLMIAGRLHWKEPGAKMPGKIGLAALDFPTGTLTITEASTQKRASLHLVSGEAALAAFDRHGLEVLTATRDAFAEVLASENHTLKRALTDPDLFSGIGNAYSDEILHQARLSPLKLTQKLTGDETDRLFAATQSTLVMWLERLREQARAGFPEKVTAFREDMAVHGRFGKPCPACGAKVQRIVYAQNECNYCAHCQTGGKLLADRALSRLLKGDWPKTLEELEERRTPRTRTSAPEPAR